MLEKICSGPLRCWVGLLGVKCYSSVCSSAHSLRGSAKPLQSQAQEVSANLRCHHGECFHGHILCVSQRPRLQVLDKLSRFCSVFFFLDSHLSEMLALLCVDCYHLAKSNGETLY